MITVVDLDVSSSDEVGTNLSDERGLSLAFFSIGLTSLFVPIFRLYREGGAISVGRSGVYLFDNKQNLSVCLTIPLARDRMNCYFC
jgi:hypothetical protein